MDIQTAEDLGDMVYAEILTLFFNDIERRGKQLPPMPASKREEAMFSRGINLLIEHGRWERYQLDLEDN